MQTVHVLIRMCTVLHKERNIYFLYNEKTIEFLEKLNKKTKKRIYEKILSTREDPFHYFERLTRRSDYKLRVGNYRVIADIDDTNNKIFVSVIGHRKNIYKEI